MPVRRDALPSHDLRRSVDDMRRYDRLVFYPEGHGGYWVGRVRPIPSDDGLVELLDDLEHDRDVYLQGDRLSHLAGCERRHCRHAWMNDVQPVVDREYEIVVVYGGGPALPRCYVTDPVIPLARGGHLWREDGAMCAFLASEMGWDWRRHSVAELVPHFLIWLVRRGVFDETGHWPGSEHEHGPEYHRRVVKSGDQCWCGSGRIYDGCCMRRDASTRDRGSGALFRFGPGSTRLLC